MKRIYSLVLCVILLCSTCYAATDFDVKDYTDNELIEIMKAIYDSNSQLGYMYSNDILVVGEDIPAGAYEFWVEEDDIVLNQDGLVLCLIKWGSEYNVYNYENCIDILSNEYGIHKLVKLEEGQHLWTTAYYSGTSYTGFRMKYLPERKSGLFSN